MKKIGIEFLGLGFMTTSVVIALVVGITMNVEWIDSNNIVTYWLKLMVVILCLFVMVHLVLYNFGNLSRAIYFKIKGHTFFPIVLYPFCFNWHEHRLQVNFTLRYQVNFYDFLPNDVTEEVDRETREDIQLLKEGIYIKQYSRLLFLIIATVYFVSLHWTCIFISLSLFIEMMIFSYVHDRKFHGERIKLENIKKGQGILYLVGLKDFQLETTTALDDMEKLLDLYNTEENQNYILAGVKRMLLNSSVVKTREIPVLAEKVINVLFGKSRKISLNPDDKELEVIMLALSNALLNNNIAMLNRIHAVLTVLQNEWGVYSSLWYNYFQWFIEMIEVSMKQKKNFSVKKQTVIFEKTDSIGYVPSTYRERLKQVEKLVSDVITNGYDR